MPKMLIKASYSADGAKGLIKEGGTSRRAAVQKLIEGLGGKMEAFYSPTATPMPSSSSMCRSAVDGLALSMAVNASGRREI